MNAILIAGAALVGLPIVLHLIMKQEPKRLTFPAFRFLKQKLKTNQRKLRLRHFVLLAMRMLLIALFCLTLYQPTFKSDRLNIRGEQPIAVAIVIDTTPSTGYVVNERTRLEEERRRALELLDELPEKSPVAVIDTADMTGHWLPDLGAARRRIEELKETRAGQPVSSAVAVAYQLLAKVDQETEATEPLPKLVAVFTDRTTASWDPGRTEDLKKLRDTVPDPKPVAVVIDFGADAPANVGILSAEMKPQVIAANPVANVTVTVGAVGGDRPLDVTVLAKLDGSGKPESKAVVVPPGQTRALPFEFRGLKPGLHQVEFALAAADKLMVDNTRFLTFKVGEARRILTITDDKEGAVFWQLAHTVRDEFSCLVVDPNDVQLGDGGTVVVKYAPDAAKPDVKVADDLSSFEVVCLLDLKNPNLTNPNRPGDGTLWDRLRPQLRAGGKLLVMPPPDTNIDLDGYNAALPDLMPGRLTTVLRTKDLTPPPQEAANWPAPRDGKGGVTWVLDEKALKHPLLKPVEEWRQQKANLDFLADPRTTKKFWNVEPDKAATPVVYYNDAAAPDKRHVAILERPVIDKENRARGKVLLLTVRMDVMPPDDEWHDYWEQSSTFFASFPDLLVRYLAGDSADANFNYPTGATVSVPLPRARLGRESKVVLDGPPIISGTDAVIIPGDRQTEIRLGPPKTSVPGNFALSVEKDRVVLWKDGFSTNVPADECNLEKVPVEAIEELVGKDRVIPIDRNTSLRDWLDLALGQPVDLFPWLLLMVLALFVVEGLAANRFYRRPRG
ncbi:BatA domain-containing protein [Frigoriglobus tundricola]|uniref:Aerotolerance regulator N-terminal domain-containing protein n=1 Tax=Frigoriglobus tundricola TaxID=2774151 RepID=A0A6M5YMY0_9BACT|nr:BatA domain-containing protein [Frigoriglobus tundricola]QJW95469.1 hypothetical protein FTUN_3018 [Frigoriglobus tundricola]